uniref:Agenet domain-containing protein n=1 Tax=Anthurium amnicola TaxID=1678845 RepID=A0A1D1YQR7_9ARAE
MDNDDDFHSQNFQLIAEDNNKFPSSLRLFSLPKLELDDHLQFHLRFDGLVEQESLLGIQDQERNSWIEDFSPGNNALALSSSAAESCSISRQKNVWSEATSSESVEMLLKSFGEDDMMNNKTNIICSESHSGLNSVSDHMDICCSQDDSLRSKEDKATDADPVLLPGQCEKDLLSLNKNASAVSPDVPDIPDNSNYREPGSRIRDVLGDVSKGEKSSNPRKVVSEQCGLNESLVSPTVEPFAITEKSFGSSCSETTNGGNLYDDFVRINEPNDAATACTSLVAEAGQDASFMPVDQLASSISILAYDSDVYPAQKFDEHVSESYGGKVLHVKSHNLAREGGHKIEGVTLTSGSGLDMQSSEGYVIENGSDFAENSSRSKPKSESLASLMDEHNMHVASEKDFSSENVAYETNTLSRVNGISGQILTKACEISLLGAENQTNTDGHSVEIDNVDGIEQSALVDSLEQAKEVINEASVESRVTLKDHHVHDGRVMSVKNTEGVGDCEGRQLEEPGIPTEEIKDASSLLAKQRKSVELCTLNDTNCGTQETDRQEDTSLGVHPPELTFQGPESLRIQKSARDEILENDRRMLDHSVNGPREVVQEVYHSWGPCVKHNEKAQLSPSQDDRSLEAHDVIVKVNGGSSDVHSALLLKKRFFISPTTSDNMNPLMDVEKLQDASSQSQIKSTCLLEGHIEGALACVTTQVESGDAVNFKEPSHQSVDSVSLPRSSSEPCSLKDDGGDPSSSAPLVPSGGSLVVTGCTKPSSVELHQQELKKGLSNQTVSGKLPQVSDMKKSAACDSKDSNASVGHRSSAFEVGSLPDIAQNEAAEILQAGEICPATPGSRQANLHVLSVTPGEIHVPADIAKKRTQKDKSKTVSRSLTEKRTSSKRKSVKETLAVKQADERDGNPCSTLVNTVSTVSRPVQLEIQQHSLSEGDCAKPSCASSVQTSNLPDSKTAVALLHQPFTDKQQVQLRAQIFVYGSLIQGVPPDEACMISAFGNTDGGQRVWEGVWRVSLDKFHIQKSPTTNCMTASRSNSGVRIREQISRSSPLQSKTHDIPVSQTSKSSPSVIFDSPVSLRAPFWNLSSPHDTIQSNVSEGPQLESSEVFSPLHVSHSSHGKQYAGNETFQVTPIRNSSASYGSNLQLTMSSSFTAAGVPSTLAATPMQMETTRKTESSEPEKHASTNQKARRKKSVVSEVPVHLPPHSCPRTELDSSTTATNHPPILIGYSMPTASPVVPSRDSQVKVSQGNEQRVLVLEETSDKTVQAKLQAEDASAVAAAAVRHSEGIWSQLSAQKNSGLVSEKEMELAYAAVAAAAASSVAKAAAAAAKVASDAVLQAKMMADEALSNRMENSTRHSESLHTDGGTYISGVPPILVLKDKTNSCSSIISAAKEAARRRVEAASAAAKRADNLDTIVKAAELAAIAVSQAATIIAMGDPLPFTLSDLIEAGPEGYWRVQYSTSVMHKEKQGALDCVDDLSQSVPQLHGTSLNEKHTPQITDKGCKSSPGDELQQSAENHSGTTTVLPSDVSVFESEKDQTVANLKENSMQEGSLVEVLSNENGLRGVWYSATILNLKNGKAYVCYNEHPNAVSDKLKEWIPLDCEPDKPPRIRNAPSTTGVKYEGTRKRSRAAVGNHPWAVGDQVDVWLHDGWCEGIVTERSKEDETKLTVHFPAGGDTSVRVWHIRPSLIWKDGQWIEWSRPRENILHPYEGDTPCDKRQKLIRVEENDNVVVNLGANKHSANFPNKGSQKPEVRPLVSSEKDKMFSLGKGIREESNSDTLRIKRTGLQKEGSRVIFGIPKPGKRRKFMEVSKHYVTGKINNVSEGNDAIKHGKYLPPQAPSGWKNPSKVELRGRKVVEPKPKLTRLVKPEGPQTRSATEREGSFLSTVSASNGSTAKTSASHKEKSENIMMEAVSFTSNLGAEERTVSESSMRSVPGIPTSKMKTNTAIESDVGRKGKVAFALEKTKNEEKHSILADHPGKTISDAMELRRSSRRIQPTSRLLEGLQSSMIIAKIPSVSHEKGSRVSHRNAPSSKGNIHG